MYNILPYDPDRDHALIIQLMESEGEEWADILDPMKQEKYRNALQHSCTFVAYQDSELCGYIRSIDDQGLDVFVLELLVHKSQRGHSLGKQLMDATVAYFPNRELFVLSDADGYYEKIGFKHEGSIFKVNP